MKTSLHPLTRVLIGFATVLLGTGAAHAGESCESLDLSGWNKADPQSPPHAQIIQNGCLLTFVTRHNQARWQFDLSGKTETSVPREVLDANRTSELGRRSMESMRIRMRIERRHGAPIIRVVVRVNLPKVESTLSHKGNAVDVDVEFRGYFHIWGTMNTVRPDEARRFTDINGVFIQNSQIRVVKVNDGIMGGPLSEAFKHGANYVLGYTDGTLDNFFPYLKFEKAR